MAIVSSLQKNVLTINWNLVGLGKKLDSQVARELGVPRRRVTKARNRLGIVAFTKSKKSAAPALAPTPVPSPAPIPNPSAVVKTVTNNDPTQTVVSLVASAPILGTPVPVAPAPVKKKLKNYIAVVLDRSGSIGDNRIVDKMIDAYNGIVDAIKRESTNQGQDTVFSLFTFNGSVSHDVIDISSENIMPLTRSRYYVGGGTALFDAVGRAIQHFQSKPDANDENVSHLVMVVTDGEENSSREFPSNTYGGPSQRLNELIYKVQTTGQWTLVFQLPYGFKDKFVKHFKVPTDNIREWAQSEIGTQVLRDETTAGVVGYVNARSMGMNATKSFFTPDLSKITSQNVSSTLDNVTSRFKSWTVEKEIDIATFVKFKTTRDYVIGSAYYQLMKPEEIQPEKSLLIREKGQKTIYGGPNVRKLIGMPEGVTVKFKPGNFAKYDIFTESRSVNRKLPRGTVVLVDITKVVSENPTWDHTKVSSN